jgi:hypothetical protein
MTRIRVTRRVLIGTAVVALLAGGSSAVALAASSPSANVYKGCLSSAGAVYNVHVNPSKAPTCRSRDKQITWNQTGPAGPAGVTGHAGAAGPQGLKGDTGAQGPAGPSAQTTTAQATHTFSNADIGWVSTIAVCPAGYQVTGGSNRLNGLGQAAQNIQIVSEYPAVIEPTVGKYVPAPAGQPGTAWEVEVRTNPASTGDMTVYAMCIK